MERADEGQPGKFVNYIVTTVASPIASFLSKLFSFRVYRTAPKGKQPPRLPLPFPSSSSPLRSSPVYDVLQDVTSHMFDYLRSVQENLEFWQCRAEGSNAQKLYFMVLERGPRAFVDGTVVLVRECVSDGGASTALQRYSQSASGYISERIHVLRALRSALAVFLAEVYMEVDRHQEDLMQDPEKILPLILDTISGLLSDLEAAIGHLHATRQADSYVDGTYSLPLLFEKLPQVNKEGSQWTDCEIRDSVNVVYKNLEKLDSYLTLMVAKHQKPGKMTQHWVRYAFGAVGLSVCSLWILRHSSLMGSPNIDNWIREAKESTVNFFRDHVELPLLSIRDDLFDTFRKRHKGVMEIEEVHLTANSLHIMLLAFSEQMRGQKLPENASDQDMMEIVWPDTKRNLRILFKIF